MNSSNLNVGKSLPTPSNHSSNIPTGPATSSIESSRRPALAGPSNSSSNPRKSQASRKQHKNQRRPGGGERSYTSPDAYDAMAERHVLGNLSGRRGQTSITHLLNYHAPRPHYASDNTRNWRRNTGVGSGYHVSDKSRYVHANYRFVVSPEGSYTQQASDTDAHLDWNDVLQVIASTESQTTSCPICLDEPVAPRMAKCGHIFCLPCLIRFMHTASKEDGGKNQKGSRCQQCPICEDFIYLHDGRPVRFYAGQESPLPRVGDDVVLRLMARNADSIIALPREGGAEVLNSGQAIPWHSDVNVLDYARVMMGSEQYMLEQCDEEVAALERQEKIDETLFGSDNEWTQKAMKAVQNLKERYSGLGSVESALALVKNPPRRSSEADFYFYSSQPHLYLSPLDIRILKTKYGSFSSFPSTLLPRVEHISTGHVVDEAMRKRARYLGHLPRGCIVNFIECDWTDIVPEETLESFKVDIERRRKRNQDKATQEERERAQAERLAAAELRRTTGQRIPASMEAETPPMDMSDFQPLNGSSGTTPPEPRPGFETLASMSTSPDSHRTIWGTRAINASPELPAQRTGPVDDGWLNDDALLSGHDLAAQMEAMRAFDGSGEQESAGPSSQAPTPTTAGSKKKKKQKITLMSTGGRRGL